MAPDESPGRPEKPEYKVYKSRRGVFSGWHPPDVSGLRDRLSGSSKKPKDSGPKEPKLPGAPKPTWRRVLKWVGIAAAGWILLSVITFAVSAFIQSQKLANPVGDVLDGNPFLAVSPQTILVLGSDVRPSGLASKGEATPDHCVKAASRGETPPKTCLPYRSDTILLVRAGGTTFRKLSIPRDTLATIPGHGGQKINSAYAFGGAKLTVETIEKFLGINIDHIAIVDFNGFRDLIDAVGGVDVTVKKKICSEISGGAANGGFSLFLDPGTHTLNADEALTLSRTRENVPEDENGDPCPPLTDVDRVAFQQDVINGIKSRLADPLRIPYNFLHGPFIGWNAPKAFISDMGPLTLPQLVFSVAISGSAGTDIVKPSSTSAAGNLVVSHDECVRAVRKFLGEDPPRDPACSPLPTG